MVCMQIASHSLLLLCVGGSSSAALCRASCSRSSSSCGRATPIGRLIHRVIPRFIQVLFHLVGSRDLADEVAHLTFLLRVAHRVDEVVAASGAGVGGWLWGGHRGGRRELCGRGKRRSEICGVGDNADQRSTAAVRGVAGAAGKVWTMLAACRRGRTQERRDVRPPVLVQQAAGVLE